MNNKEKYKNELIEVINKNGRLCDFVKNHGVFRVLGREDECSCEGIYCSSCAVLLQLWLDEEYEEPEVDWDKVPVDTLVRVQYDKSNKWFLRYFKEYEHGEVAPYVTWVSGTTSATSGGLEEHWKYCELVEDEDGNSSI